MKRRLSLLLAIIMLIGLCACAKDADTETTAPTENVSNQEDPAGDDTMNVLFISNSSCWYFTDELYGMLAAAGHFNFNLCHAYYSGCSLQQHLNFWKNGEAPYKFRVTNYTGINVNENVDLETVLAFQNWDFIVFHGNAYTYRSENAESAYTEVEPYLKELLSFVKGKFPKSKYLWYNTHVPNVGYTMSFKMTSVEQRDRIQEANNQVSEFVKRDFGFDIVPVGKAWSKVRDMELFNTIPEGVQTEKFTLFTQIFNGKISDDSVHDGDIGGGQYLNACVWFEKLTGESCMDNSFRPKYVFNGLDLSLSEEKIEILKNAAHEAVAAQNK